MRQCAQLRSKGWRTATAGTRKWRNSMDCGEPGRPPRSTRELVTFSARRVPGHSAGRWRCAGRAPGRLMPRYGPLSTRDLIAALRRPVSGRRASDDASSRQVPHHSKPPWARCRRQSPGAYCAARASLARSGSGSEPYQTTPAARSSWTVSALKPASARTASECWPCSGAAPRPGSWPASVNGMRAAFVPSSTSSR